jgi:tRNA-2-methylthio-N6-dimethylallyladenosine synthase
MKRMYTRAEFDALVKRIREAVPGIAMSTDIIVGFPGETEEDFEATCELLRSTRFDFAYLFQYSERSGTYAARNIEDSVPLEVKARRLRTIIELQESISREVFASRIGETHRVLVVGPSRRDERKLCGRTDDFKMVIFDAPEGTAAGDLVDVTIHAATSHTLVGSALPNAQAHNQHPQV